MIWLRKTYMLLYHYTIAACLLVIIKHKLLYVFKSLKNNKRITASILWVQKFYGIFSVCPQRISSKTSKILFWCQTVQVHRNIGQAILHVPTVVQIIMACCYYNFCFLSFLRRLQIRLSRLRLLDEPKVKINKSVVTDFPLSNPLSSASELITKWDTFLKLNWGFSPFFYFPDSNISALLIYLYVFVYDAASEMFPMQHLDFFYWLCLMCKMSCFRTFQMFAAIFWVWGGDDLLVWWSAD